MPASMGESLCLSACHSLGDLGGLVFTVLALAWGAWQRKQRVNAVQETKKVVAEKDAVLRASVETLSLSMRPTTPVDKPSLQTLEGLRPFPAYPPLPDRKKSADTE